MSLEDIERKFYSEPFRQNDSANPVSEKKETPIPTSVSEKEEVFLPAQGNTPNPWGETKPVRKSGMGIGKIIGIFAVGIVIVAGVAGGIFAFNKFFGTPSSSAASIDVYSPLQTQRGVPFEARVEITNESEKEISGMLKVTLSSGLLQSGGEKILEESIASLASQEAYEMRIPLFAVGDVGTNEKIVAEFISDDGEAKGEKDIYIRESGIRLTVTPRQIPGENSRFELVVRYENLSGVSFNDASLEFAYPNSFSYLSASPAPTFGKGTWELGEVRTRGEGIVTVIGTLSQLQSGTVSIPVSFVTKVNGESFTLVKESAVLAATQSPVLVSVTANGKENHVASIGGVFSYVLRVKNNTDAGLSDVVAVVSLEGAAIDFSKVKSQGSYSSADHTIRFTAAQVPRLRTLGAKEAIDLTFSVPLLQAFPIKVETDRNFTVKGVAEVTSPTVPHNSTADKTFVSVPFENKIMGDAEILVQAWRKDPWGIVNGGTFPLTPDKTTEYTVHWTLKNYATDIRDVKISSSLAPGARFTGVVKSNAPTSPVLNDRTGIVEWTLPLVSAGKGVVNSAYEVAFQIEVTPNLTQIGRRVDFLNSINLTATDVWTGMIITKFEEKLNSSITNDPTFKQGDDIVSK